MALQETVPFFIRRNVLRIPRPPQVLNVTPLNITPYIDPNANAARQEAGGYGRAQTAQPSLLFLPSQAMEEEVSRVLSATSNGVMLVGPVINNMNIVEDDDAEIFRASLPGIARDEFSCDTAHDSQILIKGITTTREKVVYKDPMKFLIKAQNLCPSGHSEIAFQLPSLVDSQDLASVFRIDGVFEGIVKKKGN